MARTRKMFPFDDVIMICAKMHPPPIGINNGFVPELHGPLNDFDLEFHPAC